MKMPSSTNTHTMKAMAIDTERDEIWEGDNCRATVVPGAKVCKTWTSHRITSAAAVWVDDDGLACDPLLLFASVCIVEDRTVALCCHGRPPSANSLPIAPRRSVNHIRLLPLFSNACSAAIEL